MYAHVYCKDMQKNPNFIIYNVKGTAKTDFFAFSRKKTPCFVLIYLQKLYLCAEFLWG